MDCQNRTILHVDMDAFFASVEQLDNPALRGKPVLVGHDGPRGVVAAASYEARKFGCHSAQPIAVAKRLCPHALIVKGRFSRYRELSNQVFALFEHFTPTVEPVSIDEAYLDVSAVLRLHGIGQQIAAAIKAAICAETGLTASVGVAPNKFLAKLASDMHKPDGLVVITEADIDPILLPLPVGRIHGIGKKTEERLHSAGIRTIAHLRTMPPDFLEAKLGSSGQHYLDLAFGRDDRPVHTDRDTKSISHEETFGTDAGDPHHVRSVLKEQVEAVAARLRRHGLFSRRVALKIRFGDFETISRSRTLPDATDRTDLLLAAAFEIFDQWAGAAYRPVRLIGMGAEDLGAPPAQLPLFGREEDQKNRTIDHAVDAINQKFGKGAIKRGA